MLVVTDEKIRDLLNLIWLNVDKVKFLEIQDVPPRFGEVPESRIVIQLSCRVEAKSEPEKKISAEFAKLMTEGEIKVRCN